MIDWRDHHPIPPTFGMAKLVAISGIPEDRITLWQRRGAWLLPPLRRGKRRQYTVWDALRAIVIAELSAIGLPISGKGEKLTDALVGLVRHHVATTGDLSEVPDALRINRGEDDWWLDEHPRDPADMPRAYVVVNLRRIAEEVGARWI